MVVSHSGQLKVGGGVFIDIWRPNLKRIPVHSIGAKGDRCDITSLRT